MGDMALAAKINDIINGDYKEYHGYDYYLETELMEKCQFKYDNANDGLKGFIAQIVVRKRINLEKSINYRRDANNNQRILKQRTNEETEKFGRRKVKVEK